MFLSIWVGVVMAGGQTGCSSLKKDIASPPPIVAQTKRVEPRPTSGGTVKNPDFYSVPKVPPPGMRMTYNSIAVSQPVIAMTFDDGPHATNTPRLLDMLRQRNIKATFFVVGRNVREYPQIVRRILAEGHELANHTWSHQALSGMSAERVHEELSKTHEAVREVAGYQMRLMRPPYGATNLRVKQQCYTEFGYPTILWNVDPLDWKKPGASAVANRIISATHAGSIILAHDIHASTIDAMPQTLDTLLAKGYQFVTVSQLMNLGASSPAASAPAAPDADPPSFAPAGEAGSAPAAVPTAAPAALPAAGADAIPKAVPPTVNGIPFEGAPVR